VLSSLAELVGCALVVAGVALVAVWLALVVAGVALVAIGYGLGRQPSSHE